MKYSLDTYRPDLRDFEPPTPLRTSYSDVALGIVSLCGCFGWGFLLLRMEPALLAWVSV